MSLSKFYVLLILLFACNVDKHKKVKEGDFFFETTESSVLFFKNVRGLYYEKQENIKAKADIYRNKERVQTQDHPVINLAIVHHWRNDKAYIMLEPNEVIANEIRLEIQWQNPNNQEQGTYFFDFGDMETHYYFAVKLYHSLQEKHNFQIKVGGKWQEFMHTEDEREVFRKTMLDYLRLVNAVK
ncbi:MAG: hypothetical protein OHK0057_27660 [Thermoflexibacter sp.]